MEKLTVIASSVPSYPFTFTAVFTDFMRLELCYLFLQTEVCRDSVELLIWKKTSDSDSVGLCTIEFPPFQTGCQDQTYGKRWIGRGEPVSWPPRSPDLNPISFFLWGHLKALIYERPVNTKDDLHSVSLQPVTLEGIHQEYSKELDSQ
ncbi:hypothetical protein J6590_015160 [Homalodisca vitripennis]|nr:hypothetical protein J6590_015160 [Homalodisca vitripennis]